jgi:hypothetical protein
MPNQPGSLLVGLWLAAVTGGWFGAVQGASPDLVVSDIWEVNGRIFYQLRNTGDGEAPSGHITSLQVDGKPADTDEVPVALMPGARVIRSFTGFVWNCSPPSDLVAVRADSLGGVTETSEANNVREERWSCEDP